jgi:hypothetical protein
MCCIFKLKISSRAFLFLPCNANPLGTVVVVATTLWISKTVMIPMLTFIGLLSDTVEIHVDCEDPFLSFAVVILKLKIKNSL